MAGNKELIDEIVDPVAVKQVDDLKKNLAELEASFISATKEAIKLNNATGNSTTNSGFAKAASESDKATKKMVDNAEKTRLAEKKLATERDAQLQKEIRQRQQAQAALDKEVAAKQKAVDKEISADQKDLASMARIARQREKDAQAFIQLTKMRDQARTKAQNIGATFGADSDIFKSAQKEFEGFQKQVDAVNNKLGNFKDDVGNYAGKAFGFIRQAAYILPGIGIAGIFGLITDGLVKFYSVLAGGENTVQTAYDLANKTNEAYATQVTNVKLLTAEVARGNPSQSRRLEIIEELNQISPTYFGNIKTESDLISKLPEDYKKYNAALLTTLKIQAAQTLIGDKYKEQLKLQQELLEANDPNNPNRFGILADFNEGVNGLAAPGKQRQIKELQKTIDFLTNGILKDNETLSKQGGDIAGKQIEINERIANNFTETNKIKLQASIDFNNDIATNDKKSYGARQAALAKATEDQKTLLGLSLNQELNDISLTNDKKQVITEKYNTDIQKLAIDNDKKERELREQASKDEIAFQNQRLERQKKTAENKTIDPEANLDDRLNALTDYQKASKAIIKNTEREEIIDAGDNAIKIKTIREKAANDLLDVDNDVAKKRISINKEVVAELLKAFQEGDKNEKAILKNSQDTINQYQQQNLERIDRDKSDELTSLADKYAKGLIKTQEYNDKKAKVESNAQIDSLAAQIDGVQKQIELDKLFNEDSASDEKKLADLQIQLSKQVTNQKISDSEKQAAAAQRVRDLEKQFADATFTFVQTTVDAGYENRKNQVQKQIDLVDEQSKAEIDAVNRSLDSNVNKAAKVQLIEAQADAQKTALQREQKRIDQEKAKFDKAVALARIVEATAVAEIEALSYLSNPLTAPFYPGIAALIGALGAIQLATVLAQPIPAYAKGTKNAKGGTSLVGEQGTEYVITPTGATFLTPGQATLMDIPKGSTVVPHLQTVKMMDVKNYAGGQAVDMSEVVRAIERNKPINKPAKVNGWLAEMKAAQSNINRRNQYFRN